MKILHHINIYVKSACVALLLCSCSAERFLPEDGLLLSKVTVEGGVPGMKSGDLQANVRQNANSRWFNVLKVPLGIYCLQPKDTTGGFARFIRRIGEPPVIYDADLAEFSRLSLQTAMRNKGYLQATTEVDTTRRGKRVSLTYSLQPGLRSFVSDLRYDFDDEDMRREVMADSASSLLYKGMPLDASLLSKERSRIINVLRDKGYYNLHKEYISFQADTAEADYGVHLTMRMAIPPKTDTLRAYQTYRLRNVTVSEDILPDEVATSGTYYKGLDVLTATERPRLRQRVYYDNTLFRPDSLYRAADVRTTYGRLAGLQTVNYSTIRFTEIDSAGLLDCNINVRLNKPHSIGAEVEGTNTSGNFGAALVLSYSNRNLFRGAEVLSLKLRGAYESITGLEGYNNANYVEYSAETALRFPSLLMPFVSREKKRNLRATSEVSLMYDSQDRPEFHRRVVTGAWTYRWQPVAAPAWQHRFDLLSLNYVFMPWISDTFRREYLEGNDPHYAILRSSYENLFIMKMGYSFLYNSRGGTNSANLSGTNGFQVRMGVETAGNLLYGISRLFNAQQNATGQYTLFDIAYSQYAKFDFDFAKSFAINERNSLAFHAAFGIALPYGNADIVPYEKRYFAGGANSVRGWSVRELGPGSYVGRDGKIDFINQTGNLKLDLSLEYRTHLFWQFHGAAFIDAGNIWNTRDYADQPGGQFRFNTFIKQIAVAYGLGLRFNMDYLILRMDFGMKAINPAIESGRGHYPILHPRLSRDLTFHFAVGMPF